jgi:hypothetical protein
MLSTFLAFLFGRLEDVADFNVEEIRQTRNTIVWGTIIPLTIIIIGAFSGGVVSWGTKLLILDFGILAATLFLIFLMVRRVVISGEVFTLYQLSIQPRGQHNLLGAVGRGLVTYIQVAAALITSVMVIGFIAIWLPMHRNVGLALLLMLAALAIPAVRVWYGLGVGMWRKVCALIIGLTVVFSLLAVAFPTNEEWAEKLGTTPEAVAEYTSGLTPSGVPLFLGIIAVLVMIGCILSPGFRWAGVTIGLALVGFILIFGAYKAGWLSPGPSSSDAAVSGRHGTLDCVEPELDEDFREDRDFAGNNILTLLFSSHVCHWVQMVYHQRVTVLDPQGGQIIPELIQVLKGAVNVYYDGKFRTRLEPGMTFIRFKADCGAYTFGADGEQTIFVVRATGLEREGLRSPMLPNRCGRVWALRK